MKPYVPFFLSTLLVGSSFLFMLGQPKPSSPPLFRDVTANTGIQFRHQASPTSHKYLIESMSSGVGLIDYDGDGLLDIFFVNGAALDDPMPAGKAPDKSEPQFWNRLFHNLGNGKFSDVTAAAGVQGAGYGMGVAVGDYDNDGKPDLYVTSLDGNTLYRNNNDGTFSNVTTLAGVRGDGWSTGALFVDYDGDGRLDLVVSRYVKWSFSMDIWCGERKPGYRAYCHPDQFQPVNYLVFHNNGDGTFQNVSEQTHFAQYPGKGLGVAMNDFDRDGRPDVFVANDSVAQQLFRNKGDGTFEEVALVKGLAYDADGRTFSGMGTDFADYDNDGWPDIFVNALARERYALFRNVKGDFDYVTDKSGVGAASIMHSGWGTGFVDYDNDGWKDLFVGQGHVMDNIQLTQPEIKYREAPLLLHNQRGHFVDVSPEGGSGYQIPRSVRGVAFGDLNNDGSIDIVMNCNNEPPAIFENQHPNMNHWLLVNTIGTVSNRDGIGATIHIVLTSGKEQWAMVTTAGSYLSANDKRVHFGLGSDKLVKLLEVTWPTGKVQRFESVAADQVLTVRESTTPLK